MFTNIDFGSFIDYYSSLLLLDSNDGDDDDDVGGAGERVGSLA